ncbi:hypothetical protein Patl1_11988 [Pistacia atlantica]|uniref:Uncharacterized protein n=1 Tax=Pistacia atlantica TaxID=434234 RepID=A0ACC1A0Z3_9ROSI|nr:hypothetical protein Patl1_11988 [Pistacia atlantica]
MQDIIECILEESRFIKVKDEKQRTALHLAASAGDLEVVSYLIEKFDSALVERDSSGFLPIHMAAIEGQVAVIEELLSSYPHPELMLTANLQNLLHVAAKSGKLNVLSYVFRNHDLEMLKNQRDKGGNTRLHLATINWHGMREGT